MASTERVVRFIVRSLATILFRIRVEGGERIPLKGGALLVSNHVSYADAVMLGYATPRSIRFLIWQPIFDLPAMSFFFRALHAIPILTDSPKSTIRALRKARAELQGGELVGIFPEGQITRTGETGAFERGFERIVDGTGAPILPIYIDGLYGHPLSFKGGKVLRNWNRFWRPKVTVRVGEPVWGPVSPASLREIVMTLSIARSCPQPPQPTMALPPRGGSSQPYP